MEQIARTPKQIGDALRRQRRLKRLTQTDLAHKIKLRQGTISTVESGEPGTQLRTLLEIMAALDLECVIRPRTKAVPSEIEDIF
jgi:HTH-type transcriptional regulator/antitoxin HipB